MTQVVLEAKCNKCGRVILPGEIVHLNIRARLDYPQKYSSWFDLAKADPSPRFLRVFLRAGKKRGVTCMVCMEKETH